MTGGAVPGLAGDRVGDWALSSGVAAFLCAFFPVIGELLVAATAPVAVVLGLIGVRRYETGQAARVVPAVAGAVLGASAVTVTAFVLIAAHVSP